MRRVRWRAVRASGRTLEAALLCLTCAVLATPARPAQAMPGRIACSVRTEPGSAVNRGPCNTPDAVDYFAGGPAGPGVVLTNFGLLLPGDRSASWQIVCDDNFGIPKPPQMRVHPDGRIFVPSLEGLYVTGDGCGWSSLDDIGVKVVFDLSFDRAGANAYALVDIPRTLQRSTDGGRTFSLLNTFTTTLLPGGGVTRRRQALYLIGRGLALEHPVRALAGRRAELRIRRPGHVGQSAPGQPAGVRGRVAQRPGGALLLRHQRHRRRRALADHRRRADRLQILGLTNAEAFSGFAFGATADTMYVAGSDPFPLGDKTPARLYVTHDGGKTWDAPIPSAQEGPRYRCLSWSDGKLYACGAGEPGGDAFLVGVSSDEGKSWAPAVKLRQVAGARSCVQSRCLKTEEWLCEYYCVCAPGTQPSSGICVPPGADGGAPARDAGADALPMASACVGSACNEKQGWCTLAGRGSPASLPWLVVLACLLMGLARAFHVRR